MALTLYNNLIDTNSNQYDFGPPPDWQQCWYSGEVQDGQSFSGDWDAEIGLSSQPFWEYASVSSSSYVGTITFEYNSNTLSLQFDNNWVIRLFINNVEKGTMLVKGANFQYGRTNTWFVKNENGIVSYQGKYVGADPYYKCYCGIILTAEDSIIADSILTHVVPVTYTWTSVSSISGKNGILQLSQIKSAELNGGDPVSGASGSVIERLIEQTKLSTLAQGLSEETPVVYSDDVNYMSLTPTANSTCTLKFYLDGNVIYSLTGVSLNAYLQLLKDETNEVMKPSIIYKSGVDTYLFHPDFYNDGRDTVRYDANNQINIGTSSGEIVENYTEGELYTYSGDAIVSNGEVYWGNERHDYLGWGFDAAKNQAVIDPNGTVTFAGSFKRTGTISLGYVHNTCAEIDIWCDPTYDADCPNSSRYHAMLIPLSIGYVSACAEDADTEDDFLVSWSGEMNYNPNADMELNTWYEFKQVWQLSGGNVASVSYYRDGVLIGTTKNVSSNAVRFVNVTGTNRKITAITLFLGNNLHAKDVYIEYD